MRKMTARDVATELCKRVEEECSDIRRTCDHIESYNLPSEDAIADYPGEAVRELREALMHLDDMNKRIRSVGHRLDRFPNNGKDRP